mgnify:FL=1
MAVSVREIRKANQEFYCSSYSPASVFRRLNMWMSLICVILMGAGLFAFCKMIQLIGDLDEAVRTGIDQEEVLDWAGEKVLSYFWDIPAVIILIATIFMCFAVMVFFQNIKSYEYHRSQKWPCAVFVFYGGLILAAPCWYWIETDNMLGIFAMAVELIIFPSLKLLLPPEFKAPFENVMKIFEFVAQRIIKRL